MGAAAAHPFGMPAQPARLTAGLRAEFPSGVATAGQLIALGWAERTIYKRCLNDGPWQRILPGVILLFTGRPTRDQEVLAALLLSGPDALVTGLEACKRHGLRRLPRDAPIIGAGPREVHVLNPAGRQVRSVEYVHVERTYRLPNPIYRNGFPLAPLPRACLDGVRRLHAPGDIAELLSEPVQRGMCTVPMLTTELNAGSRRGTAIPRRILGEVSAGIRSAAELEAKKLWKRSGLPEPWWNARIYDVNGVLLGIVDCWVDEVAMVWEIESSEWHMSPEAHDLTVERAAGLTAAGCIYTASKPRRILSDGSAVIETLRATYAQALARPRPPLTAFRTR